MIAIKKRARYMPCLNSYFLTDYDDEIVSAIKATRLEHLGGDKYIGKGVWEVSEEVWNRIKKYPHTLKDESTLRPEPLILDIDEEHPLGKYHYQDIAAEELRKRENALLFFDTGTGKTRTALLALSKLSRDLEAVIIVGESALCKVWEEQMKQFFPELSKRLVSLGAGKPIATRIEEVKKSESGSIFLVNIQAIRKKPLVEAFNSRQVAVSILDECQCIMGLDTQQTDGLNALNSDFRWALSATPIKNSPLEWHSLLAWLRVIPREGAKTRFKEYYAVTTINKWGGYEYNTFRNQEDLEDLKNLVSIRVLKDGLKLPKRNLVEKILPLDSSLESLMSQIYSEKKRTWIDKTFKIHEKDFYADTLGSLFYIERVATALAEEKVRFVLSHSDDQIIVVSCLKEPLIYLHSIMSDSVLYHGDIPIDIRDQNLDKFKSGAKRVLLMTQKSGGVGLTLTNAHKMIFLDAPANMADFNQCADRIHRIGQTHEVTIYIPKVEGSSDIYAWEHMDEKQSWIERYFRIRYEGEQE